MVLQLILPLVSALIAVAVLVIGYRLHPKSWRENDNEDEGGDSLVLDTINTFFAAVVALVVVIGWQNYDNAHNHTIVEAKALTEVHTAAQELPDTDRDRIQGLVRDYTTDVTDHEWSVMADKHRLSESTQQILDKLRADAVALPETDNDVHANIMTGLDGVAQARYDRALDANLSMPGFLYGALWFSTTLLLLGTALRAREISRRSLLMTAVLGVVVGSVILAIYNLDRPFDGGSIVPRDAFELALGRFEQRS